MSKIILENFRKRPQYFWKFQEILMKFLRIILKFFFLISENFEDYCGEFWDLFHKILKNVSENSENLSKNLKNHIIKFRKISRNTLDIFEYFGKFLELSFFEESWKLFRKIFRIKSFRRILKIISENFWKF